MNEEFIQQLKDEVDGEQLLETLGAVNIKKTGRRFITYCLSPDHKDRNPSFAYREDRHTFRCYSCGVSGDCIELVKLVKGCTFREALNFLRDFVGWTDVADDSKLEGILDRRRAILSKKPTEIEHDAINPPCYFERDFDLAEPHVRQHLQDRHWPSSLLDEFDIGFCHRGYFRDRIIFPIKSSDGVLRSFAARATWPLKEGEVKYLYPLDTKIGLLLWGLDKRLDGTPIFVEGITDALRLRQYGFNAYAILGNQLGEAKVDMIRRLFTLQSKIIVIPDNDNGGNILLEWFNRLVHDFEIHVGLIEGAKDIDRLSIDEIRPILQNTTPFGEYQVNYYLKRPTQEIFITSVVR